jgi:hypothetical protein
LDILFDNNSFLIFSTSIRQAGPSQQANLLNKTLVQYTNNVSTAAVEQPRLLSELQPKPLPELLQEPLPEPVSQPIPEPAIQPPVLIYSTNAIPTLPVEAAKLPTSDQVEYYI